MTKSGQRSKTKKAARKSNREATGAAGGFAPKTIAIMYRPGTELAVSRSKELAAWLKEKGYKVYAAPEQKLGAKIPTLTRQQLDEIDWVIVLGGDGTYLRAVQMLEGRQTPILGINMGSLGFLTEIRSEDLFSAVKATLNNGMEFKPRSMLRIEVRRKGKVLSAHIALNDAVLERGSSTHLINIAISSQQQLVANLKADALIIASPTGSTAYNLAAGGPILHPEVRAIVVTPVCPHALTSRPLIFPDDQELSFTVTTRNKKAHLTVDGVNCDDLTPDDEVVIVRSAIDHYVIRRPSSNYFSLLREKLALGQRD